MNFCTVSGNSRSVPPTLIVTTTLDVVDPADGKLSLREAITAANASVFPDTIVLPAGVFRIARSGAGEDGNATGDLDIASRMTIRGAGAGSTILDARSSIGCSTSTETRAARTESRWRNSRFATGTRRVTAGVSASVTRS